MTNLKTALLYGLLIWLIVMGVATVAFPLRSAERTLFDSIMPVALASAVAVCGVFYFGHVTNHYVREGILLGLLWFAVSFVIDTAAFTGGPLRMSFGEYCRDIGVTYLMIPVITTCYGWVLEQHQPAA
ncbi:MAG: hypothetical protein U0Q16_21875 [Bryobacteraceae bacterium]